MAILRTVPIVALLYILYDIVKKLVRFLNDAKTCFYNNKISVSLKKIFCNCKQCSHIQ